MIVLSYSNQTPEGQCVLSRGMVVVQVQDVSARLGSKQPLYTLYCGNIQTKETYEQKTKNKGEVAMLQPFCTNNKILPTIVEI